MIRQIEPWIDEEELFQLKRVVDSTFVVEHTLTAEFEAMTRELTGAKHAVAVTNGTMALYCCLKALDIGPGDEVIVPNMTFIASANAVIMAGATPVFCEVKRDTFGLDVSRAAKLVNSRTKALMPVHLYGQAAFMDEILDFARARNLRVIEDAAQGVGVKFDGKHVGTFGEMGILSYYGNKTITCGEGGIILTEDDRLKQICYRLKNHGRDKKGMFIHDHIGFNFSFTEMQAAIGIAQMKKFERIKAKKQHIYDRYVKELADIPGFTPTKIDARSSPVHWFTSFMSEDREALSKYLEDLGIQTRLFFYPLHLQPCYRGMTQYETDFSASEAIYARGISLPSAYGLSDSDQSIVIEKIRAFYANRL